MLLPVSGNMSEEKNIDDIKQDIQILKNKIDIIKSDKSHLSIILGIVILGLFVVGFPIFVGVLFG